MRPEAFIAELADWAGAHGQAPTTHPYGPSADQVIDVLVPEGDGPFPVAVLLHGGFWRARFTRSSTAALAVDLTRRGYATANVEYRRVGNGGGVPETLDDVAAALAAVESLDLADPSRIVALGHSAGGHLALWAAGTGAVAAVVALAGVCDLAAAARDRLGEGAAVDFAGGTPDERPEAYRAADPSQRLPLGVPILLVHGDADDRVPVSQSRELARRAVEAGDRCDLLELPGVDHFAPIDPRGQAWARIVPRIDALAGA